MQRSLDPSPRAWGRPSRRRVIVGSSDEEGGRGRVTNDRGEGTTADRVPSGNVGRTMFWLTFGTLLYVAMQWILTVLVFKVAGPEANGDYTLGLSSSSVAYAVVMFGMRPYQISDTRGEFADNAYFASRVITSVLAVAVALLTLPFTADFARLWPLLVVFLLFRITEGWMDVFHGVLQKADRMDKAGIALILRAVVEALVFALLIGSTGSVFVAVSGILGVSLISLLVLEWRWTRPYLDGIPLSRAGGWGRGFDLVRRCTPLLAANLAYSAVVFLSRNSVGEVWGTELLGFYGAISAPLLLVPLVVSSLYTPFMGHLAEYRLSGQPRRLLALSAKLFGAILGLILVAFALLPFVGPPVLSLIFGPSVLAHMDLLAPVAASVSLTALVGFGNAVLTAVRRVEWTMIAAVVAVALVLLVGNPLVVAYGANGASFALIVGQGAQLMVTMVGFLVALRSLRTVPETEGA